jgi:uncharacterized damage-inducible protein DinB
LTTPREGPRLALHDGSGASLPDLGGLYLLEYSDKIELALADLGDETLWRHSGPGTNSIANLILHLCGNLSLWMLASIGGQDFERDRAGEFSADRTAGKDELLAGLRGVVGDSRVVLAGLDSDRLNEEIEVQGYSTDVRGAAFHAVEHMGYHTGQIVLLAKQALAAEGGLEFYPHHKAE